VNLAGFVIHSAVHAARHDIGCLFHNHTDAAVAVASHRRGFLPVSQEACIIWPRVSPNVHPFEGVATDVGEQERILANLGARHSILLMANHGVLVGGATVAGPFWGGGVTGGEATEV
jgi:ribulose-5-phosphate 4-epimerase/fuculose-1-phosphate aldolase